MINDAIASLLDLLATAAYSYIFVPIMKLLDFAQFIFYKFAGLDTIYYNNQAVEGDILLALLSDDVILNVFYSLCLISLILFIIMLIIANVRAELDVSGKAGRKTIFKGAAQNFFTLLLVPVFLVAGITLGNALLKSINIATSTDNAELLSARVFSLATHNANRARDKDSDFYNIYIKNAGTGSSTKNNNFGFFIEGAGSATGLEMSAADLIDQAFTSGMAIPEQGGGANFIDANGDVIEFSTVIYDENGNEHTAVFNIYDTELVSIYYDLTGFDFLIGIIAGIYLLQTFFLIAMGLVKRIFSVVVYFMIFPLILSTSPLNGEAMYSKGYGKWRQAVIGEVTSAYTAIVVVNLYFVLVGLLGNLDLFSTLDSTISISSTLGTALPSWMLTGGILNKFTELFIILAGSTFIKGLIGDISKLFGLGDALATGRATVKETMATAASIVGKGVGVVTGAKSAAIAAPGVAIGAGQAVVKHAKNIGNYSKDVSEYGLKRASGRLMEKGKEINKEFVDKRLAKPIKEVAGAADNALFNGGIKNSFGTLAKTTAEGLKELSPMKTLKDLRADTRTSEDKDKDALDKMAKRKAKEEKKAEKAAEVAKMREEASRGVLKAGESNNAVVEPINTNINNNVTNNTVINEGDSTINNQNSSGAGEKIVGEISKMNAKMPFAENDTDTSSVVAVNPGRSAKFKELASRASKTESAFDEVDKSLAEILSSEKETLKAIKKTADKLKKK